MNKDDYIKKLEIENKELKNRFGLVFKEVEEDFIKEFGGDLIVGSSYFKFYKDFENKKELKENGFLYKKGFLNYYKKDGDEYYYYSYKLFKFHEKVNNDDYIPILEKKGESFQIGEADKNILIEGDNYHALQMLQYTHKGKIDVIYIDPPYNTGKKDFKYNDEFVKTEDGERHSAWLSFMNKRLVLAKELMSKESVIFISIDHNENHRLRLLCDNIFGENNFISEMPRKTVSHIRKSADYEIQNINDIVLLYAKNKLDVVLNKRIVGQKEYKLSDKKGGYILKPFQNSGENGTMEARPNLYYPIYYNEKLEKLQLEKEDGFIEILPRPVNGKDGRWLWSKNKFIKDNDILCVVKGIIKRKSYFNPEEDQNVYQVEKNWLEDFSNRNGALELKKLNLGGSFSYPKPTSLIKFLLELSSKKNSIVLDFFAGSGSTGHAVWDLNKEDGGNRKFILCTNNENNICEDITFERLKRANDKYEYNESLKYLKINYIESFK